MYKVIAVLMCVLLFCGCSAEKELAPLERLRQSMEQNQGCEFDVHILSQTEDRICRFTLHCVQTGEQFRFEVLSPESIRGIAGTISDSGGALEFDDTLLAFPLLANGEVSPIISPWLLLRCLKNGLVQHAGQTEVGVSVSFADSFRGEEFRVEAALDGMGTPLGCELFWGGRRILQLQVEAFRFM